MASNSLLFGFIRLFGILLFLFYINKKGMYKSVSNTFLEFLVLQWFKLGSILGIIIFIMVQLNSYDLIGCLIMMMIIMVIDSIGFKKLRHPWMYFNTRIKNFLHVVLKSIELKKPIISWFQINNKNTIGKQSLFAFILIMIVVTITFVSRWYFLKYDLYFLSNVWISDLEKVTGFDDQNWFSPDLSVAGEFAYINFYAKMFNLSPETAIQSIGILESILIGILLFWILQKITYSLFYAPIIAALSFALLYTIMPFNIHYLLQNNSIFLALTFLLPAFVFILKPNLLKLKQRNYFFSFLIVFFVVGLINLFAFCVLTPPFLVLSVFLTKSRSSKRYWLALLSYGIALLLLTGTYVLVCNRFETDFMIFLHTNLIGVTTITDLPQLLFPLQSVIKFHLFSALIGIIIALKFIIIDKEDWNASIAFLLYFISLLFLTSVNNSWIDIDLITQALPVFLPIIIGINSAIILRLFSFFSLRAVQLNKYMALLLVGFFLFLSIYYQKKSIETFSESNEIPNQILTVYDKIATDYLPYTYAVVNESSTQVISKNKHFFINYSDFLKNYLKQDAIYFNNIKNKEFLKKSPKYVIPKSVFLFIYTNNQLSVYSADATNSIQMKQHLRVLEKRGRKIALFHKNKNFTVYEIINETASSNISDLIF